MESGRDWSLDHTVEICGQCLRFQKGAHTILVCLYFWLSLWELRRERNWLEANHLTCTELWLADQNWVLCNHDDISICFYVSSSLVCITFAFESYSSGSINAERSPGNLMLFGARNQPSKRCQEDSLFIALFIGIPAEENSQEKNLASRFEAHLVLWVVKE